MPEVTEADYEHLQGRVQAQNLLLRALYTNWAERQPDPIGNMRKSIGLLIDSVRDTNPPQDDFEHRVWDHIDAELDQFAEAVATRLKALGHS
ncbi:MULTISPECIES: hypothetical protein [Bradyrhizobium]|uniref:Uncharacterized protein n=1 Tax=Bradyrhizobium elkanii TaxID=29448 RepID=A0A4U6S2Q1_BRAEL|nr:MULTISPECIES: hypothetical protein [Bradyrhizobium]MTV17552.1 hypothetical protein [Bradyrhizobium sp. BR2003]TKV81470.1 hypothetical protein FDV58_11330 [Bradyrhizobium elkanii]